MKKCAVAAVLLLLLAPLTFAAKTSDEAKPTPSPLASLPLRSIGPGVTSGRILDIAVDPREKARFFVAAASGGVWLTTDNGGTWTPVFEHEGVYSIGALAIDPSNPLVVWVGTGEGNSQRSVSWGDGVYRSDDGGKSWKNTGLPGSRHINRIVVDPTDTNTVYVAAAGSLWGPNKDRGLYKTTDGGKTWKQVLSISENTGVGDVAMDPRDHNVLYAAAYQRQRRSYGFIDGGPESALYKSTDGGATWNKLSGLPKEDIGRIGIAIAPSNPDTVYIIVEARNKGGVYRSTNRGATWEFRNKLNQTPWYYSRLIVDPKNADRVYEMGEGIMQSDDGGKTFHHVPEASKHGDNHTLWIDPDNTDHFINGCDGGVYITYDHGQHWRFCDNMSLTQFYTVAVDNRKPFYYVYGGTQDNNTLGGPSRTSRSTGIANEEWYVTVGGDGFYAQIDPEDPTTVYSEAQYGDVVRYDTKTSLRIGIQPQPGAGEAPNRWNWNAPLIISKFDHNKIYFGSQFLFMSPSRGDKWTKISPDLTRNLDREKLPIMGKLWSKYAVGWMQGIAFFGNLSTIAESHSEAGTLFVGTDDGVIQVTRDDGQHWTRIQSFPGVPDMTYVANVATSPFDAGTVYATFDGHKNDDMNPHVLKSTDYGKTWTSISGDLPKTSPVYVVREDPNRKGLLFAGTEFGLFFSLDGGSKWTKMTSLPTIQVPDVAFQTRDRDLAVATFGRGFYILDDLGTLESSTSEMLDASYTILPHEDATLFTPTSRFGGSPRGSQGQSFYAAENPPYGITLHYFIKKKIEAKGAPAEIQKGDEDQPVAAKAPKIEQKIIPAKLSPAEQEAAERDIDPWLKPKVVFTIYDASGAPVRRLAGETSEGMHDITWDLRSTAPVAITPAEEEDYDEEWYPAPRGPYVVPGTYRVDMTVGYGDEPGTVVASTNVNVTTEGLQQMTAEDRAELTSFLAEASRVDRVVKGTLAAANDLKSKTDKIRNALQVTPNAPAELWTMLNDLVSKNDAILKALRGDPRKVYELESPSIVGRDEQILGDLRMSGSKPTETQREQLALVKQLQAQQAATLAKLIDVDLAKLNQALDAAGAPWTPGRSVAPVK